MKKILLGLFFAILAQAINAQGMQRIVIEKYYVSDATDAANSEGAIPAGSVTYRIYIDMLPGFKFSTAYGSSVQPLKLTTTTQFFNNEMEGLTIPTYNATKAKKNTVMLDSWITSGGTCGGFLGVPKWLDNGVNTFVNSNTPKLLQNDDPKAGIPLIQQDGMWSGTVEECKTIGISDEVQVLYDGSAVEKKSFIINSVIGGAWGPLNGAAGVTPENLVLIAQVTTDGILEYEFNIQIRNEESSTERYSTYPNLDEFSGRQYKLKGTIDPAHTMVNIETPVKNSSVGEGKEVLISTNELNATIAKVVFYDSIPNQPAMKIGTDSSGFDQIRWIARYPGKHVFKAVAIDYEGIQTISDTISIMVTGNQKPVVNITSPISGEKILNGESYVVKAAATDTDGSISKVKFLIDNEINPSEWDTIGTVYSAPYELNWLATKRNSDNNRKIKAIAYDDLGVTDTSDVILFIVNENSNPTVRIDLPFGNAKILKNSNFVIRAIAKEEDENDQISKIQFFIDGVNAFEDNTSPFEYTWPTGIAGVTHKIVAKAFDTKLGMGISDTVSVSIVEGPLVPPMVSIEDIDKETIYAGDTLKIEATAIDDGTIKSIEFYVDGISIGVDNSDPFSMQYIALGEGTSVTRKLSAKAIDNDDLDNTSIDKLIVIKNKPPRVSLNQPSQNAIFNLGDSVEIIAGAYDYPGGNISGVDFYQVFEQSQAKDPVKLGEDSSNPYVHKFKPTTKGTVSLRALATDDEGLFTWSDTVKIIMNALPTISISSPVQNAIFKTGENITISALATDEDGLVSSVEIFVDGTSLGIVNSSPYNVIYAAVKGDHSITAKVTDNRGAGNTSVAVPFSVVDNVAPSVVITAPTAGNITVINSQTSVPISAEVTDEDGSIAKVYFYVDDIAIDSLTTVTTAPKTYTSNKFKGLSGSHQIKVKAIDNNGAQKISDAVTINLIITGINNPTLSGIACSLYPNPASKEISLSINVEKSVQEGYYQITDMSGVVLENEKIDIISGKNVVKIDISHLSNGHYILGLTIDGTRLYTVKFLKTND